MTPCNLANVLHLAEESTASTSQLNVDPNKQATSIKAKAPVINELITTTLRCMGEWIYTSTFSWNRHKLEVSGQLTPSCFTPGTRWMGSSLEPWTSLNDLERRKFLTLSGLELLHLDRPARSQLLYRLRCHGSYNTVNSCSNIALNGRIMNEF
jgi:hypothetical protein